ncbi:hypothetical protein L3V32_25535 [Vibrio sp. J2-4]|uniref:hypothetical protein n=1 Tax=Vibrio sp. J2-4 TaxID=1507977 RepID=UPI001F2ED2CD|nr:hypothetical protein [Vibrio sp. J2-4]MCF7480034.1 hypothetical protein [Vibrio sp. J2-4]
MLKQGIIVLLCSISFQSYANSEQANCNQLLSAFISDIGKSYVPGTTTTHAYGGYLPSGECVIRRNFDLNPKQFFKGNFPKGASKHLPEKLTRNEFGMIRDAIKTNNMYILLEKNSQALNFMKTFQKISIVDTYSSYGYDMEKFEVTLYETGKPFSDKK